MDSLFELWKTKIPKYSNDFKDTLFKSLSEKYGAEGEKKFYLGKHFSTNYELYMYAFFLGLYKGEFQAIPEGTKKVDFSHHIQYWGSKSNALRKDFTQLQEFIFMALIAETNIDLIELEKGTISGEDAVKLLIHTMESYVHGGLQLLKEKLEDNSNLVLMPTGLLDLMVK